MTRLWLRSPTSSRARRRPTARSFDHSMCPHHDVLLPLLQAAARSDGQEGGRWALPPRQRSDREVGVGDQTHQARPRRHARRERRHLGRRRLARWRRLLRPPTAGRAAAGSRRRAVQHVPRPAADAGELDDPAAALDGRAHARRRPGACRTNVRDSHARLVSKRAATLALWPLGCYVRLCFGSLPGAAASVLCGPCANEGCQFRRKDGRTAHFEH